MSICCLLLCFSHSPLFWVTNLVLVCQLCLSNTLFPLFISFSCVSPLDCVEQSHYHLCLVNLTSLLLLFLSTCFCIVLLLFRVTIYYFGLTFLLLITLSDLVFVLKGLKSIAIEVSRISCEFFLELQPITNLRQRTVQLLLPITLSTCGLQLLYIGFLIAPYNL